VPPLNKDNGNEIYQIAMARVRYDRTAPPLHRLDLLAFPARRQSRRQDSIVELSLCSEY
jgi:hypothetical protein